MDDVIIEEGDDSNEMYFITKGTVLILHKQTHTFISELGVDEYFGEVSFFTGRRRSCTARSRGFTEALCLKNEQFCDILEHYPTARQLYEQKRAKALEEDDLEPLHLNCYLC